MSDDTTARDKMSHQDQMSEARRSFTGKGLTESQFAESWALAGIMEASIRSAGSFKEKLGDYAHAFSRTEKFDALRCETIIRDIFKARYGLTMNQMREGLMQRESEIKESAAEQAIIHARGIEPLIREGDTMPFYKAYFIQAGKLADSLGITQKGARTMMQDAYREAEGRELYETGKALEDKYHRPKIEAERSAREERKQNRDR